MSLRQLQEAREKRFDRLSSMPSPVLNEPSLEEQVYPCTIDDIHYSENAILLFCHNSVIKKLLPYKDKRYDLEDILNRHACLLEGLKWNRAFTKGIHLGLAPLYDWKLEQRKIELGKLLRHPRSEDLHPKTEYVLVMRKLPKEYRLDWLLNGRKSHSDSSVTDLLPKYLADKHHQLKAAIPGNHTELWGSVNQLRQKLENNLANVDNPEKVKLEILRGDHYRHLKSMCDLLRTGLLPLFEQSEYVGYFEQRLQGGYIKRCHGDLKARNIWILPSAVAKSKHFQEEVNVLDTIDFNPTYCNIDILSDTAMLIIDLLVRSQSSHLAKLLMGKYLEKTQQTDRASQFVLQYYLVEKALVGAIVSIMYDNSPTLGEAYLQAVQENLSKLHLQMGQATQQ